MNIDQIKELAKDEGLTIPQTLVLDRNNDPFYAGTPTDIKEAQWFKSLWDKFGYSSGTHIRRIHYQLISQHEPKYFNGMPYENTDECWKKITKAAKTARYLGLVDPVKFVDRRNPDPIIYEGDEAYYPYQPDVYIDDCYLSLPKIDDRLSVRLRMPDPIVSGFDYHFKDQGYITEIWIEKSTMNDVLVPLSREFSFNLVTSIGYQSITAAVAAINRARIANKPLRIFYISDFDPAGCGMPIAVARQIEFWLDKYWPGGESKLQPIALTHEQCIIYTLPRTPIKKSDLRKAHFEATYGAGATELDALEALHPGELDKIVRQAIQPYQDDSLSQRMSDAEEESQHLINNEWDQITEKQQEEIAEITEKADQIIEQHQEALTKIKTDFDADMEPLREKLESVWRAIQEKIRTETPELRALLLYRPEPELEYINECDLLFDSNRDYMEQLPYYKEAQGK